MTERRLFDLDAAIAPLLRACPGSSSATLCKACGQRIEHVATLDDRGFFIHPGECPPAPPPVVPAGMLI